METTVCWRFFGLRPIPRHLVVCCNFTPVVRHDYRIGVPISSSYREIFNSDSRYYGGTDVGNSFPLQAAEQAHHGQRFSLVLTLPPLGVCVLEPERLETTNRHK